MGRGKYTERYGKSGNPGGVVERWGISKERRGESYRSSIESYRVGGRFTQEKGGKNVLLEWAH